MMAAVSTLELMWDSEDKQGELMLAWRLLGGHKHCHWGAAVLVLRDGRAQAAAGVPCRSYALMLGVISTLRCCYFLVTPA